MTIESRYAKKMVDSKYYSKILVNKTTSDLESGYIFVPWTFSEHTEESLKDYNDFMSIYKSKHRYCPVCGSERHTSTLMGYVLNSDKRPCPTWTSCGK